MVKKFKNGGFLPYYRGKYSREEAELSVYLRRKFLPLVRRQFPQHGLVEFRPANRLAYIKKHSKTHRYYLRFDISRYYPSVNQADVASVLLDNYRRLSGKPAPVRMQQRVTRGYSSFFAAQPFPFGLPLGTRLSAITGQALLLGVCDSLSRYPFLCYQDDFLVLCSTKADLELCLCSVVAGLEALGLRLNVSKLSSGRFADTAVSFTGFRYSGGCFGVDSEKEEAFRATIKQLTSLSRKYTNSTAFIKRLNRAINGFGHYYKHASVRLLFGRLDAFIRMRVRRYLTRTRLTNDRRPNLSYSTDLLHENYGLRALVDLYDGLKCTVRKPADRGEYTTPAFMMSRTEELLVHQTRLLKELLNIQRESQLLMSSW